MIRNKEIRIMCFEFVDPNLRKDKTEFINATIKLSNRDQKE